MFSSFFRRKKVLSPQEKNQYFAVIDIGTDMVKVLICKKVNGKGIVIGTGEKKQKLGDMERGTIIDIDHVIANTQEALIQAENMAQISPSDAIFGIAGELVMGHSACFEYTRNDYMLEINMHELQNIVQKLQWDAFDQIRKNVKEEMGMSDIDIKLVHSAISHVEIDGQKVSNPLGFKGKNIHIRVFNVFAPLVHFEAIHTIAQALEKEPLSIASEPYAVSKTLGFEDGSDFSAIFIDIGGGTTDIAVVIDGGVVATKMFAVGGRVFTKRIVKEWNIPFLEAEQKKMFYSSGKLSEKEKKQFDTFFETDRALWLDGLMISLQELPDVSVLPTKILLCGGGSLFPHIKESLENTEWWKGLPFSRKPRISYLRPSDVIDIQDTTDSLNTAQHITPMALATLALELTGEETILDRLMKKALRIVQR